MATKLVQFSDGILVEVPALVGENTEMSAAAADRLQSSFEGVMTMVSRLGPAIGKAFHGLMQELDTPIAVDGCDIEFGIGIEAGGQIPFLAISKANASLSVKISFKAKAKA